LEQVTGFNLGLCLLAIGGIPWAVPLLFGHDFGPARPVLSMLAAAYGVTGPALIFGAVLLGRGGGWVGVCANGGWVAVVLACFWFVTGPLGAVGAALAIGVGYLLLLAFCVGCLAPAWNVGIARLLPPLLTNLACIGFACSLALTRWVPAPITAGI